MKEIAQQFYDLVGVTLAAALLALFGALGGLAFAEKPTPRQAVFIVFCGLGTGCAGSAIMIGYMKVDPLVGAGVAFFLAVCAMPILGLLFGVIESLRKRKERIADGVIEKVVPLPPASPPASPPSAPQ